VDIPPVDGIFSPCDQSSSSPGLRPSSPEGEERDAAGFGGAQIIVVDAAGIRSNFKNARRIHGHGFLPTRRTILRWDMAIQRRSQSASGAVSDSPSPPRDQAFLHSSRATRNRFYGDPSTCVAGVQQWAVRSRWLLKAAPFRDGVMLEQVKIDPSEKLASTRAEIPCPQRRWSHTPPNPAPAVRQSFSTESSGPSTPWRESQKSYPMPWCGRPP